MTTTDKLIQQAEAIEAAARAIRETVAELGSPATTTTKPKHQRGPIRYDLREQLKARGLTYKSVAQCIGYEHKTLENVLGGCTISQPVLQKLEMVFGIC
jgi:hypothetical protein